MQKIVKVESNKDPSVRKKAGGMFGKLAFGKDSKRAGDDSLMDRYLLKKTEDEFT